MFNKGWVLFENYIWKLDRKYELQNRKVLAFVDNCGAHSLITTKILSPAITSLLQPMDKGKGSYDDQSNTVTNEALKTDNVWSGLIDSNSVTATDTFQEFIDAGESELAVSEEASTASTDDVIVAAVRSSAEVATDDDSDCEYDVDPTPEPYFSCKDALEYLTKVKAYRTKNSLSEKSLQCLSFVEDEIV
ncbi:hypothetical protein HPB50_027457 [Hyalomma asiaticum]|uniref:Uncharacterized protein n=1 Tax=Hyalomma asiaticum TaxID=266040 RepID=A0ACB7TSE3_HYAAI|nr:hypothetical protein HPB50_027457 [Hyalomma asiaticum]